MKQDLGKKEEEIKAYSENLQGLKQECSDKESRMAGQSNSNKPTITFVMDFNRVVKPEVSRRFQKKYNIMNEETSYNTHQLKDYFQKNDETENNTTFVMIGTNDVNKTNNDQDGEAIANLIAMRSIVPEDSYQWFCV